MAKRKQWEPQSLDAFDQRMDAEVQAGCIRANADEGGGPRVSMVAPGRQAPAAPTDWLAPWSPDGAPANDAALPLPAPPASDDPCDAAPYAGFALDPSIKGATGWSVARQRVFLEQLAESASVHLAADAAGISARSAYRLRTRSPAFAAAWSSALRLSAGRLSAIALDRAVNGRVEQQFEHGLVVGERRVPSDRLLMWLLPRLDPATFGLPWERVGRGDPARAAQGRFTAELGQLRDVAAEPVQATDLIPNRADRRFTA